MMPLYLESELPDSDGGENSYLQAQKADAVKDLSTVAVWVGRRSLYVECLSIVHPFLGRPISPLLGASGRGRGRSPAHFAHSIDGAARRRRYDLDGREEEEEDFGKSCVGANTSSGPTARPSWRPYHPFRSHRPRERETFRPSSDSDSEMTKVEQPADSTQYSPMPFVQPLMEQTIHPTDRPPAHLIGARMHDCTRKEPRHVVRRLGEKSAIEVWKSVLSSSREDSLSLSYSESGKGWKERRKEGRRRFSSCRFRIG